jgi:hypothetical protein
VPWRVTRIQQLSPRQLHHPQSEHALKTIEIVVAVQQFVFGLETERGDETIDGFADGVAVLAQSAIILGGGDGQLPATRLKDLEFEQVGLDLREGAFATNALQNFAKDKIGQAEALPLEFAIEPKGFGVLGAAQIVDPDGGIDDDHCPDYSRTRVRRD